MPVYIAMILLTAFFGWCYERSKEGRVVNLGTTETIEYFDNKPKTLLLVLILLVFVFVTGFQTGFGDTFNYMGQFKNLIYSFPNSITEVWSDNEKSPLFKIYMSIIKVFTNDPQWFLLITAFISNFFMWRVMKNESCSITISCYLYICSGLCLWAMNGIRQYIVATFLFTCYKFIINGKWGIWFLLLFVCYFWHTSVLFLIPVYFLYRRKPWTKTTMLFIIGILIIGMFYSQFTDAFFDVTEGSSFDEYKNEVNDTSSTMLIRVLFMCIPAVLAFVYREDIEHEKSPLLNLASNASILSAGLYILAGIGAGNLIARIAVYSDLFVYIILMPFIIKKILRSDHSYVAWLYIIAAGVFYYYQQFVVYSGVWYSNWLHWYFM